MSDSKAKCRRRYDRQFKEDAVALVRGGRTQTEVARDLGIGDTVLSRWVRAAQAGCAQTVPRSLEAESPAERELRRLRHALAHVTEQRDILKKALGICSAQMPSLASR